MEKCFSVCMEEMVARICDSLCARFWAWHWIKNDKYLKLGFYILEVFEELFK